jgi:hypothetical protein
LCHLCGFSSKTRMVKKPEMPLAPVTMAVRPPISGEKVGRFLNMPLL